MTMDADILYSKFTNTWRIAVLSGALERTHSTVYNTSKQIEIRQVFANLQYKISASMAIAPPLSDR